MKTPSVVLLLTATAFSLMWGCSTVDERLGIEIEPPPQQFETPDAGADAPDPRELIAYCPSSRCPPGWTTCPDSRFPCDTNILADTQNCGGCGLACSVSGPNADFTCNEGACVMMCSETSGAKDCDGIVDNGCESSVLDPRNCGACGVACAVGQSCKWQDDTFQKVGCGCPAGTVECTGLCSDLSSADSACGACNNVCDPTGGEGARQYDNAYYGCADSECGRLKCLANFNNCDGDLENGCETSILTVDNCGGCGIKCATGQWCAEGPEGFPVCMCEPGLTFCPMGEEDGLAIGYCTDPTSSIGNCGACGNVCPSGNHFTDRAICEFGKCGLMCRDGAADCNGAASDGCEVDTNRDPRNCGGCGNECDLKLGQACVAGNCVVEPCDQVDAGEVTR